MREGVFDQIQQGPPQQFGVSDQGGAVDLQEGIDLQRQSRPALGRLRQIDHLLGQFDQIERVGPQRPQFRTRQMDEAPGH